MGWCPLLIDGSEEAPRKGGLAQGHREGRLPCEVFVTIRKWADKAGCSKAQPRTGYQGEAEAALKRGVDRHLIHSPRQKVID